MISSTAEELNLFHPDFLTHALIKMFQRKQGEIRTYRLKKTEEIHEEEVNRYRNGESLQEHLRD